MIKKLENTIENIYIPSINVRKILYMFSAPFLGFVLTYNSGHLIILIISGILYISLAIYMIIKKTEWNPGRKKVLCSLLTAALFIHYIYPYSNNLSIILSGGRLYQITNRCLMIATLPFASFLIYRFYDYVWPWVRRFIFSLDNVEKKYLKIMLIVAAIFPASVAILTNLTFNPPTYNCCFSFDTSLSLANDGFVNFNDPQNGISQYLYGVFTMPFGLLAHILSMFLFFLPSDTAYPVALASIFVILLAITIVLLSRIIAKSESEKKLLYLFFSLNYIYLFNYLIVEQYQIGYFYLIILIYVYLKGYKNTHYDYIAATGTLTTSIILLPMISSAKKKNEWWKNFSSVAISAVFLVILTGRLPKILNFAEDMKRTKATDMHAASFFVCFKRFLYLIRSMFLGTVGVAVPNDNISDLMSYELPSCDGITRLGVLFLITVIVSFILNWKIQIARISGFWVFWSFAITCLFQYDSRENSLIIMGLYFVWAYLILLYLLIRKLFMRTVNGRSMIKYFYFIVYAGITIEFVSGASCIVNLIKFGVTNYYV